MRHILLSIAILTALSGCVTTTKPPPVITPVETKTQPPAVEVTPPPVENEFDTVPVEILPPAEPPRPKYNLSGFPLEYRKGYDDGCNSVRGAERKDATRYARDANYRTGWQDGHSMCASGR